MSSEPRHRVAGVLARLQTVRARATLVSVAVVGVAMVAGAIGLLSILHASMEEGVETTARTQMNDVASLVRLGQLPAQLPAGRDGTFTQVVGANGRVVATTASLLGTEPISHLHPGDEGVQVNTIPTLSESGEADPEGPYLLLAQTLPATTTGGSVGGQMTVYVASSLQPVFHATTVVGVALAIGLPLLVILVGAMVWLFSGRALRPVEAIRAEVADISGHGLHRRVPVPGSADEVARLAQTMNEMLDRLESSANAQHRFVADASHELRSPLAVLQATLEVALAHPDESIWPGVVEDALEETSRLHRLVEDLLVLARSDAERDGPGRPSGRSSRSGWEGRGGRGARNGRHAGVERAEPADLPRTTVDLDDIVLREVRRRRAVGERTEFDLHRVSGGQTLGNADQLARVVQNLIDNAQRHAATCVTVECRTTDDGVVLVVADDGPGIAPSERQRIFERFAQLDEARSEDEGGSGLGLAIAKEIVEHHGGTIEVTDSPVGARFEVRLPPS